MTPEEVLAEPARVLSQGQREAYFEDGYILLESVLPPEWLARLQVATQEMIEQTRRVAKSDGVFDLEPGHTAEAPRLRRLSSPVDHQPDYWAFAADGPIADIAADLVGPNVKYHHSKLNFKWSEGGEEVKWHQDIQAWPHTNYSPLTMGIYLADVGAEQGPLGVVPKSHEGELFDHYNEKDQWIGTVLDWDIGRVATDQAVYLEGPAGSMTIHNCRTVHGSRTNRSSSLRPLLLYVFSAADAMTYTANPIPSPHEGAILRGRRVRWAHHDPRPCIIPPDWSGGYTSLFAMQQEESWEAEQLEVLARQRAEARGAAE